MKNLGYELVHESLIHESFKNMIKIYLKNPRHGFKRIMQKASVWMKGGKIAPIAQLQFKNINQAISVVAKAPGNVRLKNFNPVHRIILRKAGITNDLLKQYDKKQIIKTLMNVKGDLKKAIRLQQGQTKRLVVVAGIVPPVASTAVGIGSTVAVAKHYSPQNNIRKQNKIKLKQKQKQQRLALKNKKSH